MPRPPPATSIDPQRPRYAIVLMNAAADEPQPAFADRTPLDAAATPNCNRITRLGRQGTIALVPPELVPSDDIALAALLGRDPRDSYPGLGPIEAAAHRLRLAPDDLVFRCNLVTVSDGEMLDARAGGISTSQAAQLIDALNHELAGAGVEFRAGHAYRHLMILHGAAGAEFQSTPAQAVQGRRTASHRIRGRGADRLRDIIRRAEAVLPDHDVNHVRRDLHENPANSIWLWGGGKPPRWPRFRQRLGVAGTAVGAADMFRGMATLLGWPLIDVPAATGGLDTDYAAKGRAAVAALRTVELVVVHIQAPDEATHLGAADQKAAAIEQIDRHIVGPLFDALREYEHHRMLVAATITASSTQRRYTDAAAPFCMAGTLLEPPAHAGEFNERQAAASGLHIAVGSDLMEYFLRI